MSASTNTPQAFTPGPWKVRDDRADELLAGAEPSGWVSIEAKEYQTVASAYNRGYETNKANARLIAAAPDLLEALQALSNIYMYAWDRVDGALVLMDKGVERYEQANAKAVAALQKARGESEQANSKEA